MGVLVVTSYDDTLSLDAVDKWMTYVRNNGDQYVQSLLVVNKSDLVGKQEQ